MAKLLRQVGSPELEQGGVESDKEENAESPGLPETFGPFVLTKRLGSGGVSEVFRAYYESDPVQAPVALKRLVKPTERGMMVLLEEAKISALLESRYIVKVLEQTRVNNRPCLVMELVDGPNLATLIRRVRYRRQAFPSEVITAMLLEVSRAMQVAHGHQNPESGKSEPVIHLDLKPSNILISRTGQVKVTDFGVARHQTTTGVSQEDALVGTLAYMAPERVDPEHKSPIDHRADLFSIGAIGYEISTLEPLYNGSEARMIQQQINSDTYVPLALEKVPDFVNPELKRVLTKLLEAKPERRHANVGELIRDLEAVRDSLKMSVDLSHFVGPYMAMDVLEEGEDRVTAHLPRRKGEGSLELSKVSGPITHLSADQLTEMLRRIAETVADPGIMARERERKRRIYIGLAALFLTAALGTFLLIRVNAPVQIRITSRPDNALVWIQPGCEGPLTRVQPSPLPLHTAGPWPVCLRFEAPGYVPMVQPVDRPAVMARQTTVDVKMIEEVCVNVDSTPKGLPIYIANVRRGDTGVVPVRVCGFEPGVPYYVQLEYNGERWDIQEVDGIAGQVIGAFHDFSGNVRATSTAMERCERYHKAKNWQRAIELCRVAVTQASDHRERVKALIIEGRSYISKGDLEEGCSVLHAALGTAVEYRDLELEQEVQSWRVESECGPAVPLTGASLRAFEAKQRRAAEATLGAEGGAAAPPPGGAPAGEAAAGGAPAGGEQGKAPPPAESKPPPAEGEEVVK